MMKFLLVVRSLFLNYGYDAYNFYKFSMLKGYRKTQSKFIGKITLHAHVVEKGLTMPNMKPNFGKDNLLMLMDLCQDYIVCKYDVKHPLFRSAVNVVYEYKFIHEKNGIKLLDEVVEKLIAFEDTFPSSHYLKYKEEPIVTKTDFFQDRVDFECFAHNRHSVRCFCGNVEMEKLMKAFELAQTAPSACNRQPNRVHVVSRNNELYELILAVQNGNRGFGNLADKLLVVTSDVSSYYGVRERMGMFVDGGIYVMNLLYALHYYKIAACTLNWSYDYKNDLQIRDILGLNCEQVIAIIAIGDVPKEFSYARSVRLGLDNVVTIH